MSRRPAYRDIKGVESFPGFWWEFFVMDPLARPLVWFLAPYRAVTPTMVTLASAVLGVASVGAFLTQHPIWGALLFEAHFLLDCVDGNLARLRGATTHFGGVLDETSDAVLLFAVAGAAAIAATIAEMPYAYLQIAVAAAFGVEASLRRIREAKSAQWPAIPRFVKTRLSGCLMPLPWTLEMEVLALFVAPMLGGTARSLILGVCLAGLGVISASYLWALLVDARRADRQSNNP